MDRKEKIELLNSIGNGTKSIEDLKQDFLIKEFLPFSSTEALNNALENDWTLFIDEFNIWSKQQKGSNG